MTTTIKYLIFGFLILSTQSRAENGYELWLRYSKIEDKTYLKSVSQFQNIINPYESEVCLAAQDELIMAFEKMAGKKLSAVPNKGKSFQFILTADADPSIIPANFSSHKDAYALEYNGKNKNVYIIGNSYQGIMYGVFEIIKSIQLRRDLRALHFSSTPKVDLRILNHWDNLNRTVERGYAGFSLWNWHKLPNIIEPRYIDYARANASIGINGTVLTNVNANAQILTAEYIEKVKALATAFRPYGLKVYLTARFSAPIELDKLKTADPLDPEVRQWWKNKIEEIYKEIPDFGGFLVKANSEGQPGPQNYGRNHADGANMLAEYVEPHGGIVMWRAFVYDDKNPEDRAKQANTEFEPLDGTFKENVLVQVKNGPIDFQPREPFHPLFGAMPKTPLMMEFQITQEYLGFSTHLVYLPTMWKETLDSDTYAKGEGSTVAKVVDGSVDGHKISGMAGVTNIGTDLNWTGHPIAQSNWYGFGRLAWDHELSSESIAKEWIGLTFDGNAMFNSDLQEIMIQSREATVRYMTPLGLHHIMGWSHHHGPAPWIANRARADWTSVYYHKADKEGIGFNRTSTGSNALSQYKKEAAAHWEDPKTCPEEYLLWFHHLPWDYKMKSGKTLWDEICLNYQQGVDQVAGFIKTWEMHEKSVDPERFKHVSMLLKTQYEEAQWWRDACLLYFQQFSEKPLPAGIPKAPHTLEYYENIQFRYAPGI